MNSPSFYYVLSSSIEGTKIFSDDFRTWYIYDGSVALYPNGV